MTLRRGRVDVPAGSFAYLEAGDPEAPLVLCLHGFPDHPPSFAPLCRRLAAAGLRAVVPWMRGYAPSITSGPFHADQLADDVIELGRALSPDAAPALCGHDWGAVAAYQALSRSDDFRCAVTLAMPHPLAFLKNLGRHPAQLRRSWYMLFFQLPGWPERALRRNDFALVRRLWRDWSPGLTVDRELEDELARCLARSLPGPIEYYRALTRPLSGATRRVRAAASPAGRITSPVLHLHGQDDGCIAPGMSAGEERYFAGPFERAVLPRAGHFLQLEAPGEVAAHIAGWLLRF